MSFPIEITAEYDVQRLNNGGSLKTYITYASAHKFYVMGVDTESRFEGVYRANLKTEHRFKRVGVALRGGWEHPIRLRDEIIAWLRENVDCYFCSVERSVAIGRGDNVAKLYQDDGLVLSFDDDDVGEFAIMGVNFFDTVTGPCHGSFSGTDGFRVDSASKSVRGTWTFPIRYKPIVLKWIKNSYQICKRHFDRAADDGFEFESCFEDSDDSD